MSTENLAKGVVEIMQRVEAEHDAVSAQEIVLDDSNKVSFPGYPYRFEALGERILVSIDIFKSGYECKQCKGKRKVEQKHPGTRASELIDCPSCKGLGATLILPENTKNLPTTGVVVSMGREAKEKANFKIGDRILFGPYAGQMIPTKVGLMFKYMDWNLAAMKIEGAEDMAAFDFILNIDE